MDNPLRQNFFRAGHAHAGVIVILSLICQLLADSAHLPASLLWTARIAVPLAAILIPAGFFLSMLPPTATQPGLAVGLIYAGAVALAVGVLLLELDCSGRRTRGEIARRFHASGGANPQQTTSTRQ
jgi:hypothetical protein